MRLRAVDLFAGGGGLTQGFVNAGFEIAGAFENWQPALAVYRANFPDHPAQEMDLSQVDEAVAAISAFAPSVVIGGPPCQDFSSAGKRDENQGRASLTIRFAEIVAACQPTFFVMENVARAVRSEAFKVALGIFKEAGYGLTIRVLDAAYCGTPQLRKRLFVIGSLHDRDGFLEHALDANQSKQVMTLRDFFGDKLQFDHYYRHPRSYARRGVFSVDEPSPTIRGVNRPVPRGYPGHEGDSCRQLSQLRSLTTVERARIQTFPDDFLFPGNKTDVEQVIGNAVPVKLAEYVARQLMLHATFAPTGSVAHHQLVESPPNRIL